MTRQSPTYRCWSAMKRRCYNPNAQNFKHYGGRGISVCERWKASFKNFVDDMGERPEGKTLDRINHEGNYEPSNCRWATQKQQMANTRVSRIIEFQGKSQTLQQWADELRIPAHRLRARIDKCGMSVAEAFSVPGRLSENAIYFHDGRTQTLSAWAREYGIKMPTLWARIRVRGLSLAEALTWKRRNRAA